jgi:hypothetical protein
MPRVKLHDGLRVNSEELCLDVGLARGDDGGEEETILSTSTATFRAICENRPDTLPSITLDLRDEDLEALAPKARAAWERLQALFADEDG